MDWNALIKAVHYDPATGVFTRKLAAGNAGVGRVVGAPNKKGYWTCSVLQCFVKLHRLAWFYTYKSWPTDQIDHINGNKGDNRISNLRSCDTSTNCANQVGARKNNVLGIQGVHRIRKTGRYRACCNVRGEKKHLGVFGTAEEAQQAYLNFKKIYLPETRQ